LKIKKYLWANGFKKPGLACVFHQFCQNPPLECKELRDAGIVIRFRQPAQRNLQKRGMWKKL